jgi:hypothetical protein
MSKNKIKPGISPDLAKAALRACSDVPTADSIMIASESSVVGHLDHGRYGPSPLRGALPAVLGMLALAGAGYPLDGLGSHHRRAVSADEQMPDDTPKALKRLRSIEAGEFKSSSPSPYRPGALAAAEARRERRRKRNLELARKGALAK